MERVEGPVIGSRLRRWIQNPHRLLSMIGLGRGHSFLDIGCGRGFLTLPAAHIVGDEGVVYAVDTSSQYLRELRQRVISLKLGNVVILETDAAKLEGVPDMSVDRAAMMLSLHHLERKKEALTVLRKKLREGSSILVVDPISSRMLGHGTAPAETLQLFKSLGYAISRYSPGLFTWTAVLTLHNPI